MGNKIKLIFQLNLSMSKGKEKHHAQDGRRLPDNQAQHPKVPGPLCPETQQRQHPVR